MHVFARHQLLFPLLVALGVQLEQGEITDRELDMLGKDLGDIDAQLDLAEETSATTKPQWIVDKVVN